MRKCPQCTKPFEPRTSWQVYCTNACAQRKKRAEANEARAARVSLESRVEALEIECTEWKERCERAEAEVEKMKC